MRIRSMFLVSLTAVPLSLGFGVSQALADGEGEFMRSCAVCHGLDGRSNTSFSDLLTVAPPNLTTLTAQNDGVFPMLNVIQMIDGRTGLRGHGSEMPIWGDRYEGEADMSGQYGAELIVRGRVLELAEYIASIQE